MSGTYASRYSSGVSSLAEWGDPGPDLGPGGASQGSSIRGNVGSAGSSEQVYGKGSAAVIKGSLAEMSPTGAGNMEWDMRRGKDNATPVSMESKDKDMDMDMDSIGGGVGKAM